MGSGEGQDQRKHDVSFETAVRVFSDPFALTEQDRVEDGEYRWQTIGMANGALVLLIATPIGKKTG